MATARRGTGRDKHEDKNVQVCKSATGKRKTEKREEGEGGCTAKTLSTLPKFLLGSLAIFYFVAL